MRLIILLTAVFLLSGCVGVGVMTMHNPDTELDSLEFKLGEKGFLNPHVRESQKYTKEDVLVLWGEPDSKAVDGAVEEWRYNREGLAWAGLIPVVIIPIPLVAPVGKNGVVLSFNGNELIKAKENNREGGMAMCGWLLMDHPSGFQFDCFSDFGD